MPSNLQAVSLRVAAHSALLKLGGAVWELEQLVPRLMVCYTTSSKKAASGRRKSGKSGSPCKTSARVRIHTVVGDS